MRALMQRAIADLLKPFLPPEAVSASFEIMGLDTQLIADGTYFAVEEASVIVGCGGWSRRTTLFGGDHTAGRDAALLDPRTDAARVRAMYTHPDHARRGVGRVILDACEAAAPPRDFKKWSLRRRWRANRSIVPAAMRRSSTSRRARRQAWTCR